MPLNRLLTNIARAGGMLITKRVVAPIVLPTGITTSGMRVKSTDSSNNMCIYSNVNQQLLKAEVWHDKEGAGQVRLELDGNPRADLFANSAGNMQGGIQASLHDLATCAVLTHLKRKGAHLAMNIQFLQPVPIAGTKKVSVIARVVDKTYGHVFVDSELYADKNLASIASHTIRAKQGKDPNPDPYPPPMGEQYPLEGPLTDATTDAAIKHDTAVS